MSNPPTANDPGPVYEYDLAVSFAGEDRAIAKEVSTNLARLGYSVFYDEFEKEKLWGADLLATLGKIYSETSRYCLILISEHYTRKPWTNHERQFAISRALNERQAYILPLRLDDTSLPGLSPTIGYLDLRNSSVAEVCQLLTAKLGKPLTAKAAAPRQISPESVDAIRKVISVCYRRAVFTRYHAQLNHEAMFASIAECRATLQPLVIYVEPEDNQRLVAGIVAELDLIERVNQQPFTWSASGTAGTIDGAKLRVIHALSQLAQSVQIPFVLPTSITEELFFDKSEADGPPTGHETWEGWIGGCGGFKG